VQTFSVLTLNTWFLRLPFGVDLAADINERANRLPSVIQQTGADIVLLQEVWDPKIRRRLINSMNACGYPFSAGGEMMPFSLTTKGMASFLGLQGMLQVSQGNMPFLALTSLGLSALTLSAVMTDLFRSKMGNGLLIFSKFPLEEKSSQLQFTDFTRPDEYFVAKGALKSRAKVPGLGWCDLVSSHIGVVSYLSEQGSHHKGEERKRSAQIEELHGWLHKQRTSEVLIMGADLNVLPRDTEGKLTQEYSLLMGNEGRKGFIDAYAYLYGNDLGHGHTDSLNNPYKASGMFRHTPDGRIDYIWYTGSRRIQPTEVQVVCSDTLPSTGKTISDHYGVLARFEY
jgi:endonuclease/exonuclease/phosphatase family metal-dependent hydrolase